MGNNVAVRYPVETKAQKSEECFYTDKKDHMYYLKITETRKYLEVFDGMKTFRIYGMNAKDLETLKENGQLGKEFSGYVHVLSKTGNEYKTDLGKETFNEYVVMDFNKITDREILRKMVLARVPSKLEYKEAEAGKRVYATATYEEQDVYVLIKRIIEKAGGTTARASIPKYNDKRMYAFSAEFEAHYANEINAMREAIDDYAKTGEATKILNFVNSLLKQLDGKVTPSRETADLMFRYMYEVQKAYETAGRTEKVRLGMLAFDKENRFSDYIAEATKTDEGRTWLTGILQKWEVQTCQDLDTNGFASYQEQARALDLVVGRHTYKKGAYREYQDRYLKARKTGKLEDVGKIMNPIDYEDVAKRTGGKGWKALGPSTLASYMIGIAVERPPVEKKPEPPPVVEKAKPIYTVVMEEKKAWKTPDAESVTFTAELATANEMGDEIPYTEYLKLIGLKPTEAKRAFRGVYILQDRKNEKNWYIVNPDVSERSERKLLSAYYDNTNHKIYAVEYDKNGEHSVKRDTVLLENVRLRTVEIEGQEGIATAKFNFGIDPWDIKENVAKRLFWTPTKDEGNKAIFTIPNYSARDKHLMVYGTIRRQAGEAME